MRHRLASDMASSREYGCCTSEKSFDLFEGFDLGNGNGPTLLGVTFVLISIFPRDSMLECELLAAIRHRDISAGGCVKKERRGRQRKTKSLRALVLF